MKAAQFQRFLALHARKFGLLTNNKVFKRLEKGASKFFVRSDKFNLLDLATMHRAYQMYATNHNYFDPKWANFIIALRKVTTPSINIQNVAHRDHEQEFLLWIDKLASFVIPVNKHTPLEKINFDSLEEIRRQVISLAIGKYHKLISREDFLPRALAAVLLYKISYLLHGSFSVVCAQEDLSHPVSLEYMSGEVMLSTPTLQKVKQKLEGV